MTQPLDVNKVIAKNPQVNRDQFDRGMEAIRRLHESGVLTAPKYDLLPPFSRKATPSPPEPTRALWNK
jgi:hypothetical protein